MRLVWRGCITCVLVGGLVSESAAQTPLTWSELRARFEATNPTLKAAQAAIDESRATEITAYLRPNPQVSVSGDDVPLVGQATDPFQNLITVGSISYLHERQHKRELRRDSALQSTVVADSTYRDQERGLLFNLRNAFVQTLHAKAVFQNATDNLKYWDRELDVNRRRFNAGDLAQVDLNRLELQRVQFEADFETATVNIRTSKIQLLTLLNDRTPLDQFDVTGPYEFHETLMSLPPLSTWFGVNVSVPLRLFDRNQGEKLRTEIDVGRNEQLRQATEALVFSDVDSAYWTLIQTVNLLKAYQAKYLPLAEDNRNRITIAFQNGGASLLDFLDAEKTYRDTRLAYVNLVGSYLTAAAQMNAAVGLEVIP